MQETRQGPRAARPPLVVRLGCPPFLRDRVLAALAAEGAARRARRGATGEATTAAAGPVLAALAVSPRFRAAVAAGLGCDVAPTFEAVYAYGAPCPEAAPHVDGVERAVTAHLLVASGRAGAAPVVALAPAEPRAGRASAARLEPGTVLVLAGGDVPHRWTVRGGATALCTAVVGFRPVGPGPGDEVGP